MRQIQLEPQQVFKTAEYSCNTCGLNATGTIEVEEETDTFWTDVLCERCGDDDLNWGEETDPET